MLEAYLDIETTGFDPGSCRITVVGIYLPGKGTGDVVQLIGDQINPESLYESLSGVGIIHTYNGSRFDLPFIDACHGVNLADEFCHIDLMYHCWSKNLFGGLKSVERQLGISRRLTDVNGFEAVRLWWRYVNDYDEAALKTLLEYNKEDVVNLKAVKDRLHGVPR